MVSKASSVCNPKMSSFLPCPPSTLPVWVWIGFVLTEIMVIDLRNLGIHLFIPQLNFFPRSHKVIEYIFRVFEKLTMPKVSKVCYTLASIPKRLAYIPSMTVTSLTWLKSFVKAVANSNMQKSDQAFQWEGRTRYYTSQSVKDSSKLRPPAFSQSRHLCFPPLSLETLCESEILVFVQSTQLFKS